MEVRGFGRLWDLLAALTAIAGRARGGLCEVWALGEAAECHLAEMATL